MHSQPALDAHPHTVRAERAPADVWPVSRAASTLLTRVLLGGVLAAQLAASCSALLEGGPAVALLTTLLCLPVALAMGAVIEGAVLGSRALGLEPVLLRLVNAGHELVAAAALMVLVLGFYVSNRYITDFPFGGRTALGYVIAVLAAALAAVAVARVCRRRAVRRWLSGHAPALLPALLFIGAGIAMLVLATRVLPQDFERVHVGMLVVALLGAAAGVACLLRVVGARTLAFTVAVLGTGMASAAALVPEGTSLAALSARSPRTLSWRAVEIGRGLFDRDGDGHSAVLGGGDCDDDDPHAYPLSPAGRDCLGWMRGALPPVPPAAPLTGGTGPRLLVLVTIDSFRCGFGQTDRQPMRDACPRITGLARLGQARLDVRTSPATQLSLREMFLGGSGVPGPNLGDRLRQAGFTSRAIATHPAVLRQPAIRAMVDQTDETLVPQGLVPHGSTSQALTERAIAWLQDTATAPGRRFLWAHYYDPHHPYVDRPGAFFVFERAEAYAAELRRTDQAVGRLADALAASPLAADTLLLVTADHGEELGGAGHEHHGTSLREPAVRIPLVAWSPGADPRRFVPAAMPASSVDLRGFVAEILGGPRFTPATEVALHTPFSADPQLGIVVDGWKLVRHLRLGYHQLFHLADDPGETRDLAGREPGRVFTLGGRLAAHTLGREDLRALLGP